MGSLRIPLFFLVRKINHLLLTHISETRTTPALGRTQKFCTLGSGNLTQKVYRQYLHLASEIGVKGPQYQVLYYPDIRGGNKTIQPSVGETVTDYEYIQNKNFAFT